MITYCNLDVSFLIVIKQFFNAYLGLLKGEFYNMQCRAKENIYNTLKLILHDSSMVGCFSFFFAWLEYENSLYADTLAGTS